MSVNRKRDQTIGEVSLYFVREIILRNGALGLGQAQELVELVYDDQKQNARQQEIWRREIQEGTASPHRRFPSSSCSVHFLSFFVFSLLSSLVSRLSSLSSQTLLLFLICFFVFLFSIKSNTQINNNNNNMSSDTAKKHTATIPIRAAVVRETSGPFVIEDVLLDEPRDDEVSRSKNHPRASLDFFYLSLFY